MFSTTVDSASPRRRWGPSSTLKKPSAAPAVTMVASSVADLDDPRVEWASMPERPRAVAR